MFSIPASNGCLWLCIKNNLFRINLVLFTLERDHHSLFISNLLSSYHFKLWISIAMKMQLSNIINSLPHVRPHKKDCLSKRIPIDEVLGLM